MNSRVLIDESVSGLIIRKLTEEGIDLKAVIELSPGISDPEVIVLAKSLSAILITEDKDFGEWVFAHKLKGLSVIFIRYSKGEEASISSAITQILMDNITYPLKTSHHFVTITKDKVRARILE